MYKSAKNDQIYYATPLMAMHTWPSIVHKYKVEEFRRIDKWTYLASRETYRGTMSYYEIFRPITNTTVKRILCDLAIMRTNISRINALVATTVRPGTHRLYLDRASALGMTNFYLAVCQRAFDGIKIDPLAVGANSPWTDTVFDRYIALQLGLTTRAELAANPEPLPWYEIRHKIGFYGLRYYDIDSGTYLGGLRTGERQKTARTLQLKHPYFAPVEFATGDSWDLDLLGF